MILLLIGSFLEPLLPLALPICVVIVGVLSHVTVIQRLRYTFNQTRGSRLIFDLVGIGNPVYDIIVTPSVKTDGRVLSGCSTNACLAAKRLGLNHVGLVGRIGRDFGDRFLHDMMQYEIEADLNPLEGETGGFSLIYDAHGDRTLDVLGVAEKITAKNFPDEYLNVPSF